MERGHPARCCVGVPPTLPRHDAPPSKIEVGKFEGHGYNCASQTMSRLDKPKRRSKALAASNTACLGVVICCLCSGGGAPSGLIGTPPLGVVTSGPSYSALQAIARRGSAALTCGKPLAFRPMPLRLSFAPPAGRLSLPAGAEGIIQGAPLPPLCIAGSVFSKNLHKGFHWPDPSDALSLRVLEEYGSMFVARGVMAPLVVIFPDRDAVARWQSSLSAEQTDLAGIPVRLQSAALRALMKAREEAFQAHLAISPRGTDAAQRSYDETLALWRSRVNPGLRHWVDKGRLSAADAEEIRRLPAREQAVKILELENRGLYFSKDFSKSILSSVAPPGGSQHLSLLAFDVKENDNPVVRSILEHHGWFQTVTSDLPHFTYLGIDKQLLPSLGLKMVRRGERGFWIPDIACAANRSTKSGEQVKRQIANRKTQK